MKTKLDDLLFMTQDEAQAVLDRQDPGYEVAITNSGYTIVVNQDRDVALTFAHSHNQK